MLKRQFCRNVEHYYVREYWSEEYAERGNYHGYFPFNEPCTVLWWKGLLLSPCRERQIEKAWTFSPHLAFGCSCLAAKSRTLCHPGSGKEGELGWRVMLAARAGSAVTRGAGSKGHPGLRDHVRACQSQSTGEHAVGFWSRVRTRAGASQGFALVLDGDLLPERVYGRYPHSIRVASS